MDQENKQEFEKLGQMVKEGFDAVDERFEQVDKRFEQVDKKLGQLKTELKDYIDQKVGGARGDIIALIKGERERDRVFKVKLVELLARNKLIEPQELEFLTELIR